jgi:hypothetical protein
MSHLPVLVVLPVPLGLLISALMSPRSARATALALLPLAVRECARAHSLPSLRRSANIPHAASKARMPRAVIASRSSGVAPAWPVVRLACSSPGSDEMFLWPGGGEAVLWYAPAAEQVASRGPCRASPFLARLVCVGTLPGAVCLVFPLPGSDELSLWPGGGGAMLRHATAAKQVGPSG